MNGKYLLDTNIVVGIFAGDASIQARLATEQSIFIPVIVIGELYYGAARSAKVASNTARVDEFVKSNTIVPCDVGTTQEYARVKSALAAKGRPIPENDIWIAALALEHQLVLVTRDHHFSHVDGLSTEAW